MVRILTMLITVFNCLPHLFFAVRLLSYCFCNCRKCRVTTRCMSIKFRPIKQSTNPTLLFSKPLMKFCLFASVLIVKSLMMTRSRPMSSVQFVFSCLIKHRTSFLFALTAVRKYGLFVDRNSVLSASSTEKKMFYLLSAHFLSLH